MSLSRPHKSILQGPFIAENKLIEDEDFIHRVRNCLYHQSQDLLMDISMKASITMCLTLLHNYKLQLGI